MEKFLFFNPVKCQRTERTEPTEQMWNTLLAPLIMPEQETH